jgi:S1-C subfamily serine protease
MNDKPGMMILLVNTESPAYHANIKVGDVLLEANGQTINNITHYQDALRGAFGKKVALKIDRKGVVSIIEVQLGEN